MEDSKPLITAVIPTFRRPRLLRRAINLDYAAIIACNRYNYMI